MDDSSDSVDIVRNSLYEVMDYDKRSRMELHRDQPPRFLSDRPLEDDGDVEAVRMEPSKNSHQPSSGRALPRLRNHNTVSSVTRHTCWAMSRNVTALPDVHQSGGPLKTVVGVGVLF